MMGLLCTLIRFGRNVRFYSNNYYDILKVKKTASDKEIKESFVKLCKELHPDKRPDDPSSHAKFVKLNEAYTVLSKNETRQIYDSQLKQGYPYQRPNPYANQQQQYWRDDTLWQYRDRSKDKYYEGKPYYGIKGINRYPNLFIASACIAFMLIGTIFQFYSIRFGRGILDEKSKLIQEANSQILTEKQKLAQELGIDAQLELLRIKSDKRPPEN